jgi:ribosomal protein S15P/S13E
MVKEFKIKQYKISNVQPFLKSLTNRNTNLAKYLSKNNKDIEHDTKF